ncbi:B3 domain-containing protein Os01g0234100-like isoform X2 [Olea europaea var. sylvestris]|uniref:B3 domain-containing protein Os01g0234100-like isoform X2 n=1 Tax=Olea europaea var. sylvestris TaxID=158386 RepID=UPI000C1CFD60|nr:B3 domain-containing protein Os01g0234100-like isoform X2 [Olea europaea var. sylvestris]
MRLKIVHQNQQNRVGDDREMKKEEEMEHTHVCIRLEEESTKENSSPLNPSPISVTDPVLASGKRKRKPKEINDEMSPILRRRKKPSTSKSKDAKRDSSGTLISNGHSTNDGSSSAVTPVQVKSPTMIRAEEFQSSLGNEHPNFLKTLVRSHVASCFWMGLPMPFCKLFLPTKDTTVTIEDENGEEFGVKYIANKTGLSAGWRKFVSGNKLLEGDVLIFQLVEPCRFKVYIIRANNLTEVDGALSLLILDSQTKQSEAAEGTADVKIRKRRPKSLPLTVVQKKKQKAGKSGQPEEQSGIDSDEVASEVFGGSKCSGSSIHFKDVKSFEEFHIVVNGVCIDSELPEPVRRKYYELCCSKNAFLHEGLLPGLYCKLVAGMIFEVVNTADAIKACKLTTPRSDFEVWEKSLRSFELLGLNVGFLWTRLGKLLKLAFDSEGAVDAKKYWKAKTERARTEDEIRDLEAKLVELKEVSVKFDAEIESLKSKAERYELVFQEEVNAPW